MHTASNNRGVPSFFGTPCRTATLRRNLDALVDKLYGRAFAADADRVAHRFALNAASAKQPVDTVTSPYSLAASRQPAPCFQHEAVVDIGSRDVG
jgi:hypothetical protein